MTNSTGFLQQLVVGINNFVLAYEQCKLLSDRIAADSASATNLGTAASATGRSDLSTADFDNFNSAMQLLETTLNGTNASVNTGGSVRLAFYKIL